MNMSKNNVKSRVLLILFIFALGLCAFHRYKKLNSFYENRSVNIETHSIGEEVPFGPNIMSQQISLDGYTLCVNDFIITDYQEYIENSIFRDTFTAEGSVPDCVALVNITLRNIDSTAPGIMLTDISVHGVDQLVFMNWELLLAENPELHGEYGISLAQGTSHQLTLPFNLHKEDFSWNWDRLDLYPLYLQMTGAPTQKNIRLQ